MITTRDEELEVRPGGTTFDKYSIPVIVDPNWNGTDPVSVTITVTDNQLIVVDAQHPIAAGVLLTDIQDKPPVTTTLEWEC